MAINTHAPQRRQVTTGSLALGALVALFVALMVLFILGPLMWLGIHAFAGTWIFPNLLPDDWTLRWWQVVFNDSAWQWPCRTRCSSRR
ncbi:part of a binding-protein-dependent transport system [Arthrobacter sp. Hiyo6]|nr:part of a binding-protein-dependent transport system [Arthrobacter sp. Hiyo6]